MIKLISILLLVFSLSTHLMSQSDTVRLNVGLSLNGRWQTGNLNQLGLNPRADIKVTKKAFSLEFKGEYQFLSVENFTVINDLWLSGLFKLKPEKKVHLLLASTAGYAKSYKIDHSYMLGAGIGLNLVYKSPAHFFQTHFFAGYLDLKFDGENPNTTSAIGSITRAMLPIGKKVNVLWELQTYHPLEDRELWGGNNLVRLQYQIYKGIHLGITHIIVFNNKTVAEIQKTNTLMLFGVQYRFQT